MPQIQSPTTNPHALSDLFDYLATRAGENTRAFADRVRQDPGGEAMNFMPMGMAGNLRNLTQLEKINLAGLIKQAAKRGGPMAEHEFRPVVEVASGRQIIGEPGKGHGPAYEQLSSSEVNPIGPNGKVISPIHGFVTNDEAQTLVPYPIKGALTGDSTLTSLMNDMIGKLPKGADVAKKIDSLLSLWDEMKDFPSPRR